ncbi:extracellular catalytic domain type 1 short-chain-length polyhydroxyalkanoate depolymerase [Kinneretia aquatilis]|uniref:extracellular catalytic domain type 1 short-chain-length polyhydroxyalkanoate depolymerase n=1 Tax=Kinneretia aquatilis TaxID=2070761 RepID=UPI001CBA7364|nr:PHB depolymerase family esterase [Paucibacter aquatile]WIV97267.1 PHB depolymerase family esterase [Paucibacter aquatile]
MSRRTAAASWLRAMQRSFTAASRLWAAPGTQALARLPVRSPLKAAGKPRKGEAGTWLPGLVMGASGMRRYRLYQPAGVPARERLPLLVMLHGCGQDANSFALSTRMNRLAERERFLVLYPEQDRLSNSQACWNWFDTDSGRAQAEAALILQSVDQVCLLRPADRTRVAIAGLSSGASMAALVATRYPDRFKAVVMHSGVPPGFAHSGPSALGAMLGRHAAPAQARAAHKPTLARPPLLAIHGRADLIVSPHNSEAAALVWAQASGARPGPARTVHRGQRYPMSVTEFKCGGSTVARLVAVDGLAHAWSGGAAGQAFSDAKGPDASRMVWAFALQQFGPAVG